MFDFLRANCRGQVHVDESSAIELCSRKLRTLELHIVDDGTPQLDTTKVGIGKRGKVEVGTT